MAMFPALMNDTMFSDLFDDPFFEGWRNMDRAAACDPNMSAGMMSTDVRETDKGYMVDIDMPGFKKDDISLDLQNGYLTVAASMRTRLRPLRTRLPKASVLARPIRASGCVANATPALALVASTLART